MSLSLCLSPSLSLQLNLSLSLRLTLSPNPSAALEPGLLRRNLLELLHAFNEAKQQEWAKDVDDTVVSKLQLPLLRRDDDAHGTMHVNFDPMLVRLLREVHYLLKLQLQVPETAMSIFKSY